VFIRVVAGEETVEREDASSGEEARA